MIRRQYDAIDAGEMIMTLGKHKLHPDTHTLVLENIMIELIPTHQWHLRSTADI